MIVELIIELLSRHMRERNAGRKIAHLPSSRRSLLSLSSIRTSLIENSNYCHLSLISLNISCSLYFAHREHKTFLNLADESTKAKYLSHQAELERTPRNRFNRAPWDYLRTPQEKPKAPYVLKAKTYS
jgi:hypothetical protein